LDDQQRLLELGKQFMIENYPDWEVYEMNVIQSGGIKTIWKMDTSQGTFCLKRIRKSIPSVRFTTSAQDYLYRKGAWVARIAPTRNGQLFFVHEGYALALYEWIEGSDLQMDEDPDHLAFGLKGLARFHLDSVGYVPPADSEISSRMGAWPDHYEKLIEELTKWKKAAQQEQSPFHQAYLQTVDDMLAMADQALQLLQTSSYAEWVQQIGEHGYLCHQDYGSGNALLSGHNVYILDLDNLTYDIPLRDVRKLIVKRMDELQRWDEDELQRIIACYESVFALSEAQRRILYIDLLFPHEFHGASKNPFKKGKKAEANKIMEAYEFEIEKAALIRTLLS
jgi:spore coat protein, CotS family